MFRINIDGIFAPVIIVNSEWNRNNVILPICRINEIRVFDHTHVYE